MTQKQSSRPTFRVEPWFEGFKTIIIAGGPSVTLKTIHTIAKARLDLSSKVRVIAVNDAIYPAWWADWLHACDQKWWNWHIQRVQHFTGIKTTLAPGINRSWAEYLEHSGEDGFDPDPTLIRHGRSGAYQALHCAIHAGSKEIILVGVDLCDGSHWFGDHPMETHCDRLTMMGPAFETIIPAARERGVTVLNASPSSRLECFPKVSLEARL